MPIATLDAAREEPATVIAKLRGSIGHLNREGRDRLNALFQRSTTILLHLTMPQ
jgi:chromosome segregation protein